MYPTKIKSSLLTATIAAGILALAPMPVSAQEKVALKFLTAWGENFEGTQFIAYEFGKRVTAESKGRITFKFSGPEVVPAGEQLQTNSSGVFDLLYTTPVYYQGTTGVIMPFFALPPDSELWHQRGYWKYADDEFARFNLKLISLMSLTTKDDLYQLVLKKPLAKGPQPLKGLKIRGNIFYKPIVEPLGGSLVNLPIGDIYSALQKGVVDGAASPVLGTVNFKWYEVAKYVMRPRFGLGPNTITMNLKRFNGLSESDRTLIMNMGREFEKEIPHTFDKADEDEIAELKKLGMQETHLDPEVFEKVNKGFLKGVWNIALTFNKKTSERVKILYDMAKKNGDAE